MVKPGEHYRSNLNGQIVEVQYNDNPTMVRFGWENKDGDWKTETMLASLFILNFTYFS